MITLSDAPATAPCAPSPAADGLPLMQVKDVTLAFGGLVALRSISLSIRKGEIVALLGPNGAGKTTLFNVIAGALRPNAGQIWFCGRDITRLRPDARAKRGVARTFQITQPFAELTVTENVMVGCIREGFSLSAMRKAAEYHINRVGLWEKRDAPARALSTGQRKRLELARALATQPQLLLMDEVSGGVDQRAIRGLIELACQVRDSGITLVIIEHNMRIVAELADRSVFLVGGEIRAEGAPGEIARHPLLQAMYLGEAVHG